MKITAAGLSFAALAAALGLALALTVKPGIFTIDECNHLAAVVGLRHGRLTLPGLEGISPSTELAFFNPRKRQVLSSPPVHDLPPLYAFIALPFSYLGLSGLFILNTLAFVVTAAVLFLLARSLSEKPLTPWLAAVAFALASYCIEYAQALWPHMLSVCLCTAAFALAFHAWQPAVAPAGAGDRLRGAAAPAAVGAAAAAAPAVSAAAFTAGLLSGVASGIRYQNIVFAACLGLGTWLWSARRWPATAAFAAGAALPLAATALLNHARLGSFNPISKGPGYLGISTGASLSHPASIFGSIKDFAVAFWFRVVDYSVCPPVNFGDFYPIPDAKSGAYIFLGAVKKAWVQSSPWVPVALVSLLLAWRAGREPCARAATRAMRAASLIVWPVLVMFAVVGAKRTDGICFNQRYFLELVPLASLALALEMERYRFSRPALRVGVPGGALVAAFLASAVLGFMPDTARETALMRVPLVLSAGLVACWVWAARGRGASALAIMLGACLAWSLAVHLGDDVSASRRRRADTALLSESLRARLPGSSAIVTWTVYRNVAAPLQLDRDLIIIDASRDHGRDAPRLIGQLMKQERRVFLLASGFDWQTMVLLTNRFGICEFQRGLVQLIRLGWNCGYRQPGARHPASLPKD